MELKLTSSGSHFFLGGGVEEESSNRKESIAWSKRASAKAMPPFRWFLSRLISWFKDWGFFFLVFVLTAAGRLENGDWECSCCCRPCPCSTAKSRGKGGISVVVLRWPRATTPPLGGGAKPWAQDENFSNTREMKANRRFWWYGPFPSSSLEDKFFLAMMTVCVSQLNQLFPILPQNRVDSRQSRFRLWEIWAFVPNLS